MITMIKKKGHEFAKGRREEIKGVSNVITFKNNSNKRKIEIWRK